jgi:hypothetical protein
MMNRVALIAVAAVCLSVSACQRADKRITKANFDLIKPGMSRTDVDNILGPGQEVEGAEGMGSGAAAVGVVGDLGSASAGRPALRPVRYGTEKTHIMVLFNRQDKVHDGPNNVTQKGLK